MGLFDFMRSKKSREREALDDSIKQLQQAAFPLGETQIQAEAARLRQEMNGRLSHEDCRMLVQRVKVMILLSDERNESKMADYVFRQLGGKLSREESRLTYLFIESLTSGQAAGGSGTTADDAVIIKAENTIAGVRAEVQWLEKHFGQKDKDWELVMKSHGNRGGRVIEEFRIKLKDGAERTVHFDISGFYGKFI